jgi:hypothetical protein
MRGEILRGVLSSIKQTADAWSDVARCVENLLHLICYCKPGLFPCVKHTTLDMLLQARYDFAVIELRLMFFPSSV